MSEPHKISLRERIRINLTSAMEQANINQVQLAEKLGISKGTVNNWARGNNSPDVDMVPNICEVLGISIIDLYSPTKFEQAKGVGAKNTPDTTEAAPGEKDLELFDKLLDGLISMGFVRPGEDITERQAEVLTAICRILNATFQE